MSKFIKSVGKARYNGIGFNMYANKDGSVSIRPHSANTLADYPKKFWLKFESEEKADEYIDNLQSAGLTDLGVIAELTTIIFKNVE